MVRFTALIRFNIDSNFKQFVTISLKKRIVQSKESI
jgi:hypothetical protein